jgi:hypothetical protein
MPTTAKSLGAMRIWSLPADEGTRSLIAAYAEAANRCTKMSHSVYLACNGLVITVTQEYDR